MNPIRAVFQPADDKTKYALMAQKKHFLLLLYSPPSPLFNVGR